MMSEYDYISGYFEPGISVLEKSHTAYVHGTNITFDVVIRFDHEMGEYDVFFKDPDGDLFIIGSFPTDVAHKMLSSLNTHIPDVTPES